MITPQSNKKSGEMRALVFTHCSHPWQVPNDGAAWLLTAVRYRRCTDRKRQGTCADLDAIGLIVSVLYKVIDY